MNKPPKEIQENPVIDQDGKPVLSQESVEQTETKTETASEKKEAANHYQLRQDRKRWKEEVEKAKRVQITPSDVDAAMDLAKNKGFKLEDEKEKEQVNLIVETADLVQKRKEERASEAQNKILITASRENLAETLMALGYEKNSPEYRNAGQLLFNHFGTDNPDAFLDSEKIQGIIENYATRLMPKKKSDVVEEALINKGAGETKSSGRLASSGKSSSHSEARREAERLGISESVAVELLEKRKNLPSFAR